MAKIEAQISLRLNGETELRKANDVLLVRLPGFPWTKTEHTTSRIVVMDSTDYPPAMATTIETLHAEMTADRNAGDRHPVRNSPFAVESTPDSDGLTTIVERSTVQLDINELSKAEREQTLDATKQTRPLSGGELVKLKKDLRTTPR